jgi:hypothetical protein
MEVTAFVSAALAIQVVNAGHDPVMCINGNMRRRMRKPAVISLAAVIQKVTTDLHRQRTSCVHYQV